MYVHIQGPSNITEDVGLYLTPEYDDDDDDDDEFICPM
jgi:hypothetical protein